MAADIGPVVVGTDFSESAAAALAEARRLGALLGVAIEVAHVVDGAPATAWREGGRADEWLRSADLDVSGLTIRFGSPWVELVRFAEESSPVLLVLGSHGLSGYQPLAIGSTAARVSMHARCPVVLVSPKMKAPVSDRVESEWGNGDAVRVEAQAGTRSQPGNSEYTEGTR
jgi:nucleotide-binding universal stress UspA family protein